MLIALLLHKTPGSVSHKTKILTRIGAKLVDLFIVVFISAVVFYPLGPLLGFAYSILADGINQGPFEGQSVGKKLLKLKVINRKKHSAANFRDSALRNAPVGVATFFAIIPVWGWLILILVGLPLMLMEIYLMLTVETGHRLGDVMGETEVVEQVEIQH